MVRDFVADGPTAAACRPHAGHWHEPFVDRWKLKLSLFDLYGALPAAGDRHLAEFFPYFLTDATHQGADYGVQLTTHPAPRAAGRQPRAKRCAAQSTASCRR